MNGGGDERFETEQQLPLGLAAGTDELIKVFDGAAADPGGVLVTTADYTVAPPGDRDFDVRMGLLRDPSASPMLAGAYRDTLTVSISINP